MDVFLMVRRKKLTIFTDCKDNTSVLELKRIIEGILKVPPADQQLYNKDNSIMEDNKTLEDYGMSSSVAKAQNPATVGLAIRKHQWVLIWMKFIFKIGECAPLSLLNVEYLFRTENGEFEPLEIAPLSPPPDLPYVMKNQEANGQENAS